MPKQLKTYLIQLILFLATVITSSFAGGELIGLPVESYGALLKLGLWFSIPFLGILTIHEFGHYITAKIYKVKATLPYYIPFIGIIGTLGAFIRLQSMPRNRKQFFDIGIAGPLAGFVAAIGILIFGFTHLPPADYIYKIHNEYRQYGADYGKYVYQNPSDSVVVLAVGGNLLFNAMEKVLVKDKSRIPNDYEMMHYPLLFAGYLALFFTALNLFPIGQLDGGHILYGLVGVKKHKIISTIFYTFLVTIGGIGIFTSPVFGDFVPLGTFENFILFVPIYLGVLYFAFFARITKSVVTNFLITVLVFVAQYIIAEILPNTGGFIGYMFFAFIIGRLLGLGHPKSGREESIGLGRKILGWFAFVVLILCFSFQPIYILH